MKCAPVSIALGAVLVLAALATAGRPARADKDASVRRSHATAPTAEDLRLATQSGAYEARTPRGSLFRDPEDGMLDASGWLAQSTGFLPIPLIITEPAVDFGMGVAPAFFHGRPRALKNADGTNGRIVPPSATAAGGAATLNGTWFVFAGHFGVWNDDRIRYTGAAGYASVNIDVYGVAGEAAGRPLAINIKGAFVLQDIQFRVRESNWWVGGRYVFFSNDVGRRNKITLPGLQAKELDSRIGGLGPVFTYDSRDNVFSPNEGIRAQATLMFFEPGFGSDFAYQNLHIYGLGWKQVAPKWNLGLRLDGQGVEGDTPFYALPFVQMRGVPAMRYQGNAVLTAEAQLRYDLTRRWGLTAFGGYGRASRDAVDLFRDISVPGEVAEAWSVGGGFRYLVARKLGLRVGLDIARGPEQWTFYVVTGDAWFRP